ncbi:MAG: endolytic transglycosylase MltG [Spirochaetaceae bacterium]|nr:endolytic transglycosylase MltG [Spirochaetaceae bacterium]
MGKKIFKFFLFFFFLIVLILGAFFLYYFKTLQPYSQDSEFQTSYKLQVPYGKTLKSVAQELEENYIIQNWATFYLTAKKTNLQMKAGTYNLNSSMSVFDIFELLKTGRQDNLVVRIPEGYTTSKIAKLLEKEGIVSETEFIEASRNKTLLEKYGIPNDTFEGYIFPDTYFFNPGMSGESVLCKMVDNFFNKIGTIDGIENLTDEELFYVVRLASIIEREYRVASEAPLIASVFTNRLNNNIGLYSCATIVYIITEIEGRPHPDVVTNKDLKIDSPYNTYMWAGLPPGAISNPGIVALSAAANPPKTNYFYFRLIDSNAGKHYFSEDFEEHIEAEGIQVKRAAGS